MDVNSIAQLLLSSKPLENLKTHIRWTNRAAFVTPFYSVISFIRLGKYVETLPDTKFTNDSNRVTEPEMLITFSNLNQVIEKWLLIH